MKRALVAFLVVLGLASPAQAAVSTPVIQGGYCTPSSHGLWWSGGGDHTGHKAYRAISTNAGDTWSSWSQVSPTWIVGDYLHHVQPNPVIRHRYAVTAVDATTESAMSAPYYCPRWRLESDTPQQDVPWSDEAAAAYVQPKAENVPANATENAYVPSPSELATFYANKHPENVHLNDVTGGFAGTTDEILQWGAMKWGVPSDVLKAMAENESNWKQDAMGDREDGVNASLYPAHSRIDSDSVYESLSILQIKWRPDGSRGRGTEPLRWKSTAFAVDYAGAQLRYYFDGLCTWCNGNGTYSAGQEWPSVGAWYQPTPWGSSTTYVTHIKEWIASHPHW